MTRFYRFLALVLSVLVAASPVGAVTINGQLKSAQLENLSSDPTGSFGRVYYNTTSNAAKIYNGTSWTSIGSGAGSKNYISAGTNTTSGWAASGAGVTIANDSTAADLPRAITSLTGIKITGATGGAAYAFFNFQLDTADYGTKLGTWFAQNPLSGYVASDFRTDVYSCTVAWSGSPATTCSGTATRLSLTPTDVSAVTALPNATYNFQTSFDAPGSGAQYLQLRIGLNGTNTHSLVVSDVTVGPGVRAQGPALSGAISWTPTFTGLGTPTLVNFWFRQIGSQYHVWGSLKSGTNTGASVTMTLPNGYSVDSTQVVNDTTTFGWTSTQSAGGSSGPFTNGIGGVAFSDSSDLTKVFFQAEANTGPSSTLYVPQAATSFMNSSSALQVNFTVPIAQLAGSAVLNLAGSDGCEYASNSSTTDADDTASFVNGPLGAAGVIGNTALTARRLKEVKFLTTYQNGDFLGVQFSQSPATGPWIPVVAQDASSSISPLARQSSTYYGVGLSSGVPGQPLVDVYFGTYSSPWSAAGYAGTGFAWNSMSNTEAWRVAKCKAPQPIGFANASASAAGLSSYEDSGSFTASYTGAPTTALSVTYFYARVGKIVALTWTSAVAACTNANTLNAAVNAMPVALRPARTAVGAAYVEDNSAVLAAPGVFLVNSDGSMTIEKTLGNNFTASGNCGVYNGAFSYSVN